MKINKNNLIIFILICTAVFCPKIVFAGVSISLTGSTWTLGTKGASNEITSAAGSWTVTNDSGRAEDVNIKVTSTGSWTASADDSPTINEFLLRKDSSSGTIITGTDVALVTNLANGGTSSFGFYFKTPPVGSEEGAHTLTVTLTATNWAFACGDSITLTHTAGTVAPVTKVVTYGTVSTTLTGSAKCWITQNLGASASAATVTESTEPNAGWYWQFNRKQGYYQPNANGALISTATPSTWDTTQDNLSATWEAAKDPCTLLLGTSWRIPTNTEWTNADAAGAWANYNDTFASVLKLHAAGYLSVSDGTLVSRGSDGSYWSSTQYSSTNGYSLYFYSSGSNMSYSSKAYGFSVRCLRD